MAAPRATRRRGGAGAPAEDAASASTVAGLLLLARTSLMDLGLPSPAVADILHAAGARPSQAYARRRAIHHLIRDSDRGAGRPRAERQPAAMAAITQRVLRFLMDHPGAVCRSGPRRSYSHEFRQLVLALRAEHPDLDMGSFATAVQVPLSSLRAWLSGRRPCRPAPAQGPPRVPDRMSRRATCVVRAWLSWRGSFTCFCEHVQHDLGLPWKRSVIARVLAEHGLRMPRGRPGRPSPAHAPRGTFETFFPGAQWVTDGMRLTLRINDRPFAFNVQLVVDTASGAVVGASLRDHEDSHAVLDAFADAVATTGAPPLALLLDNRPCNHSARVSRLSETTSLIYAARGRPQSKGHVEGAFGLFSQSMPPLEVRASSARELARQLLGILVQGWARALNARPRRDRGGRSRVALYRDAIVTPAAREAARARLCRRMARAARRRRRPAVDATMHAFFVGWLERLAIRDPDGATAAALCHHPLDAALAGLATYESQRATATAAAEADGAYLLGIVRNLAEHDEGLRISEALWRVRAAARTHMEAALDARVRAAVAQEGAAGQGLDGVIDAAMAAGSPCERRLWLMAAARALHGLPLDHKHRLYRRMSRRVHASLHVAHAQRLEAVRYLASVLLPVP